MKQHTGRYFGVLSCGFFSALSLGQPDLLWIEQFGTSAADEASALASDGSGGVFVVGGTHGDLGDPSAGGSDAFVVRYDGAGEQVWVRQFGGQSHDTARAAASDGTGGVFIVGYTEGSLGGLNAGGSDIFLVHYNANGFPNWIRQFGTSADDIAGALVPDGQGGVFVSGATEGNLGAQNAGYRDVFLARYNDAGEQGWIAQFGTLSYDQAEALAPDGAGGVFIAGDTQGDLGGPNAGSVDAFLARYDNAGDQSWIMQFGTLSADRAEGLTPDGAGGVFVSGYTAGDLGDPNAGLTDIFLARHDGEGTQSWIKQLGTQDNDLALALAPDGIGGAFLAGKTLGSLGGPNAGGYDAVLARYDGIGNQAWITQLGTDVNDDALALASDGVGNLFVAGDTLGSLGGKNAGDDDVFLARFDGICEADCDSSGTLNVFDYLCFINQFSAEADYADCDGNGTFDLFDFLCFVNQFNLGC